MPATFAAVVRVVARRPGIRLTELAEEVYRNAPNGGPVTAYNCISTAISRHRARLELFGIRLAYVGGNQQGGFKLVFDKVGA